MCIPTGRSMSIQILGAESGATAGPRASAGSRLGQRNSKYEFVLQNYFINLHLAKLQVNSNSLGVVCIIEYRYRLYNW